MQMTSSLWIAGILLVLVTFATGFQIRHLAQSQQNYVNHENSLLTPAPETKIEGTELTQQELDAFREQEAKTTANKNWLLRAYEEQLQKHQEEDPKNQNPDLFYKLSTNKELARLAGLPSLDTDPRGGAAFKTGVPQDNSNDTALRNDSGARDTRTSVNLSQPLISPLGSVGMNAITMPLAMKMDSSDSNFLPAPSQNAVKMDDSHDTDLDTPGMIAAKKDPLADSSLDSANSDLLVLPGETTAQAQGHQDNLELALPMDATQLHAQQARELSPPTLPQPVSDGRTTAPVATTPALGPNATPYQDPNAPKSTPPPVITPVRSPNPSPYDILNR